ncbi:hypothetical protein FQR65_LT20345 [Abscondita terminalis]|nr:hypothetical protein FQR65_LT20345 [Abscondita terminalis]
MRRWRRAATAGVFGLQDDHRADFLVVEAAQPGCDGSSVPGRGATGSTVRLRGQRAAAHCLIPRGCAPRLGAGSGTMLNRERRKHSDSNLFRRQMPQLKCQPRSARAAVCGLARAVCAIRPAVAGVSAASAAGAGAGHSHIPVGQAQAGGASSSRERHGACRGGIVVLGVTMFQTSGCRPTAHVPASFAAHGSSDHWPRAGSFEISWVSSWFFHFQCLTVMALKAPFLEVIAVPPSHVRPVTAATAAAAMRPATATMRQPGRLVSRTAKRRWRMPGQAVPCAQRSRSNEGLACGQVCLAAAGRRCPGVKPEDRRTSASSGGRSAGRSGGQAVAAAPHRLRRRYSRLIHTGGRGRRCAPARQDRLRAARSRRLRPAPADGGGGEQRPGFGCERMGPAQHLGGCGRFSRHPRECAWRSSPQAAAVRACLAPWPVGKARRQQTPMSPKLSTTGRNRSQVRGEGPCSCGPDYFHARQRSHSRPRSVPCRIPLCRSSSPPAATPMALQSQGGGDGAVDRRAVLRQTLGEFGAEADVLGRELPPRHAWQPGACRPEAWHALNTGPGDAAHFSGYGQTGSVPRPPGFGVIARPWGGLPPSSRGAGPRAGARGRVHWRHAGRVARRDRRDDGPVPPQGKRRRGPGHRRGPARGGVQRHGKPAARIQRLRCRARGGGQCAAGHCAVQRLSLPGRLGAGGRQRTTDFQAADGASSARTCEKDAALGDNAGPRGRRVAEIDGRPSRLDPHAHRAGRDGAAGRRARAGRQGLHGPRIAEDPHYPHAA